MANVEETQTRKESITHDEVIAAYKGGELKGVKEGQLSYIEHFVAQDDAWRAEYTKKLVRKMDFRILPCLILMYLLNFLDR